MSLYDELIDKQIIFEVNKIFYEKIYDHPWIGQYFKGVPQEHITQQQTDFIIAAIGGPNKYSGRLPTNAHPHMFINDALFELRKALLVEAFEKTKAPEVLREKWLKLDESFRRVIVKQSVSQCEPRYPNDPILNFPDPDKKAA